jgi:NADPH:quinone reductase-like Zn-dependent oxidoreductase
LDDRAGLKGAQLQPPLESEAPQRELFFSVHGANGAQLSEITSLIDAGVIRPVMDRVFPFASTNEAIAYVEAGRARGKVVVKVR